VWTVLIHLLPQPFHLIDQPADILGQDQAEASYVHERLDFTESVHDASLSLSLTIFWIRLIAEESRSLGR
jgi:hypothetical protein